MPEHLHFPQSLIDFIVVRQPQALTSCIASGFIVASQPQALASCIRSDSGVNLTKGTVTRYLFTDCSRSE